MDDKWSALEKYNLWNGNSYLTAVLEKYRPHSPTLTRWNLRLEKV